jgi:hypothetical protein
VYLGSINAVPGTVPSEGSTVHTDGQSPCPHLVNDRGTSALTVFLTTPLLGPAWLFSWGLLCLVVTLISLL